LISLLGFLLDNTLENSSAHIQNWLSVLEDDKTMSLKASGKAAAAVEYICGKGAGATPVSQPFSCYYMIV
jgi:antirestriction protein ArdC